MIVFTVIGVIVSVILIVFFGVIGYGEFMYDRPWEKLGKIGCKIFGHKIFNRKGVMHDYCLRCGSGKED